jgi:hypothetical protein
MDQGKRSVESPEQIVRWCLPNNSLERTQPQVRSKLNGLEPKDFSMRWKAVPLHGRSAELARKKR